MNICVIPARGGSKRIPHKNVKEFCGKPIIAWSIEAATAAGCFDQIVVSTDDDQIADVAQQFGASVPFKRIEKLSGDHVGTIPVVHSALQWCSSAGINPDFLCCIYATAPFIQKEDILRGLQLLSSEGCDYAFSATDYPYPIQRALRITKENRIQMLRPENFNVRSQDFEDIYHDAGQFYWGTEDAWRNQRPFFSENSIPVTLPRRRVQDIDTPEDWATAELMFRAIFKSGSKSCK